MVLWIWKEGAEFLKENSKNRGKEKWKQEKRTHIGSFSINMNMYSVYDAKEMLDNNSDIFYINDEFDIESTS